MKIQNSTILIIAVAVVAITATGYFAFKSGKKTVPPANPNYITTVRENNNWDDTGGYRVVAPGGVAFYYDVKGVFKGRSDEQGNWVGA